MRIKISDRQGAHDELWVVVPDHPEELPVVWIVYGHPDNTEGGWRTTTPVRREHLPTLVRVLSGLLPGKD